MNADAADIVRALVELSGKHPRGKELLRDVRDLLTGEVRDAGTLTVTLTTPSGDEPGLAASVTEMLKKKYNRGVQIHQRRDRSLIGGAVLQIGDEQIDLSVRGALGELEAKLRGSPVA